MPIKTSAGLLPYRRTRNGSLEVLLAHYGGPFFVHKDAGAWTVVKGEPNGDENQKLSLREGFATKQSPDVLLEIAKREFLEETGIDVSTSPASSPSQGEDRGGMEFIPLGEVKQRGGKLVHAWAFDSSHISLEIVGIDQREVRVSPRSVFEMEWPPRSGQIQQFPEIDRAEFFSLEIARQKINQAQVVFLERLENYFLKNRSELLPAFAESHGRKPVDECDAGNPP